MKKIVLCLLAVLSVACQAKLIDDFESYNLGITRLVASPPWTAVTNTGTTEIFDDGTGNKVLIFGFTGGTRGVFNNNIDPVKDNTTGTVLFFSVYVSNENVNNAFGLTDRNGDSSTNFGFNDFEVQVSFGDYTTEANDGKYNIAARNGSNMVADTNTWYHIWTIIDQVNDTFDLYVAKDEPVFKNAILVSYQTPFRNADSGPVGDLVALLGEGDHVNPRDLFIDNIYMGDLLNTPYDQSVSQLGNGNVVDVTLTWKPAVDTEGIYDVNPNIVEEYVFIGTDADNQYFVGQLGDPGTELTESEFVVSLDYDTTYYWTVVDAISGREQSLSMSNTLDDVDPNNFVGETLSFESLPTMAVILEQPANVAVFDTDDVAQFTFAFTTVKNPVVAADWYKDGVKLEASDTISVTFTDTVGDGTATLSIANPTLDDEGKYYCILSTIANEYVTSDDVQTETRILKIKKLLAEYTFDNENDPLEDTGEFANEIDTLRTAAKVMTVPLNDPNRYQAIEVTATVVDGINGSALYLDGDEYVDLGLGSYPKVGPLDNSDGILNDNKVGLGRGLDEGAILCWVKLQNGGIISYNANNTGGMLYALHMDGETARMLVRDHNNNTMGGPSGSYSFMDDFSMYNGNWHMLAATWSENYTNIYINGELVAHSSNRYLVNITPWQSNCLIGVGGSGQPNRHMLNSFMIGAIDEYRVYNYEISAESIANEYAMLNELGVTPCQNHNFAGVEFNYDNTAASYCVVDLIDFAAMAGSWLANGF